MSYGILAAINWIALVIRMGAILLDALSGDIDGYRG
jgi:hypothetical protein